MVTVITRTIGPSGRDYASFTLAEADVTNIGTSADLVANDEAIVFEADAGTYNEPSQVYIDSTLVTDATRHVTYKAAPGSEHGGILGAGVFIDQLTGSRGVRIDDANTHLIGLGVRAIYDACATTAQGTVVQNCIFESTSYHGLIGLENAGVVAENCVSFHQGVRYGFYLYIDTGFTAYGKYRNCTAINRAPIVGYGYNMSTPGGTITAEIVNCLAIGDYAYGGVTVGPKTVTGSNNFGPSLGPFPAALQGSPYPITPTTSLNPGAGDWAIYEAATGRLYDVPDNDVWGQGVGPSSNPDVPTTDIVRALRSGSTANPGAFEAPAVFTTNQSVAPNGRLEADRISHIYPYTYIAQSKTSALSGGETVSYHWYFKVDASLAAGAGETITFSIKDSGGTVVEEINWAVAYDDATPTVALGSTTTAGSGYTTDALEYVAISNDWVRCSITLTDFGSTGQDVEVTHTSLTSAASAGTIYDVTLWGSEITTIDRTPTATDLRPISGGIVDYDAYPAEHRSLFASYEDAGDNWYKVTMNLTEPN
jgi:hypothetical protein